MVKLVHVGCHLGVLVSEINLAIYIKRNKSVCNIIQILHLEFFPQEIKERKNNIPEDVDYSNIYNSKEQENN